MYSSSSTTRSSRVRSVNLRAQLLLKSMSCGSAGDARPYINPRHVREQAKGGEGAYPAALLLLQRLSRFLSVCLGLRGDIYCRPAQHQLRPEVELRAETCAQGHIAQGRPVSGSAYSAGRQDSAQRVARHGMPKERASDGGRAWVANDVCERSPLDTSASPIDAPSVGAEPGRRYAAAGSSGGVVGAIPPAWVVRRFQRSA